jgi:hypothetical protein
LTAANSHRRRVSLPPLTAAKVEFYRTVRSTGLTKAVGAPPPLARGRSGSAVRSPSPFSHRTNRSGIADDGRTPRRQRPKRGLKRKVRPRGHRGPNARRAARRSRSEFSLIKPSASRWS